MTTIKSGEFFTAALKPIINLAMRKHLDFVEKQALICAEVEKKRMEEANANIAYFQRRAAIARSDKINYGG